MERCGDAEIGRQKNDWEIGGNGDSKIENDGKIEYWGNPRKKEIRATEYPKEQ